MSVMTIIEARKIAGEDTKSVLSKASEMKKDQVKGMTATGQTPDPIQIDPEKKDIIGQGRV